MAAPRAKRPLEGKTEAPVVKRTFEQVAKAQQDLALQLLREGNREVTDNLLRGLSEPVFRILETMEGSPQLHRMLRQHRQTRDEQTEMARLVLDSAEPMDLSVSLTRMSLVPRDIVLNHLNPFLSSKDSLSLARTTQQSKRDMTGRIPLTHAVDAEEYVQQPWTGMAQRPTRFKNVRSLETLAQLPSNTVEIEFAQGFNVPLLDAQFPRSLQTLKMGQYFDQSLEGVVFPQTLQFLELAGQFNHSLVGFVFPPSLRVLIIEYCFDQSLVGVVFPDSLQTLRLRGEFNQPLVGVVFPNSLQTLELGFYFNQSLVDVIFPDSLKTLTLGGLFNQPLEDVVFPPGMVIEHV